MNRNGPIASSTLSPNTNRNHMLPRMWNQPPGMNIDVSNVYQPVSPSVQASPGPIGTATPGSTLPSSSAGIAPSSQTDFARVGSTPNPCTNTHVARFTPMIRNVATEVPRV